jgi:hypothetical protein
MVRCVIPPHFPVFYITVICMASGGKGRSPIAATAATAATTVTTAIAAIAATPVVGVNPWRIIYR